MKFKSAFKGLMGVALASSLSFASQAANITVHVHKSDGSPLKDVSVSYTKSSSKYNFGTTNDDGIATKNLPDNVYSIVLSYNNTTFVSEPTAFVGDDVEVHFYTTTVNYHALGAVDNAPISGVSLQLSPLGTSWYNKGITNESGVKSNEFFPGEYFVKGIKTQTSNVQPISIIGNGVTPGTTMDYNHYLTKVVFKAKAGSPVEAVEGVNVWFMPYSSSTSSYSLGNTDASGNMVTYLFPGSYTFIGNINQTSGQYPVTLDGDGTNPVAMTEITSDLTKVVFSNSGSIQYKKGSSYYGISKNVPKYMYPGTYTFRFRGLYYSDITISGANFFKTAAIITLKDHAGNPFALSSGKKFNTYNYSIASFENHPDNTMGTAVVLQDTRTNNTWKFALSKNNTTSNWIEKDLSVDNVFNFQTNLLTLKAEDCQSSNGIEGVTFRYFNGSYTYAWPNGATNSEGQTSMEVFAGNALDITATINGTREMKSITIDGNNTLTFVPTKVKFNYPYGISYYDASGYLKTVAAGNELYMFAGNYTFNFKTNVYLELVSAELEIPSTQTQCVFQKTPVVVKLRNSVNAPLADASVAYYQSAWKNAEAPTNASGNTILFANGNPSLLSIATVYLGSREQKSNVNLASVNNIVVFNTSNYSMSLIDADGQPLTGGVSYQYYASSWKNFGIGMGDEEGQAYQELLGNSYSVAMSLNGVRKQINYHDFASQPNAEFQASKFVVRFVDADGQPLSGAIVSYYANGWKSLGTTDENGYSEVIDLFAGVSFTVKVVKGAFNQSMSYSIPVENLYDTLTFVNGISVASEMYNIADESNITVYPNPAHDYITLDMPNTGAQIDIITMDGKLVKSFLSQSHQEKIDISHLPAGNYIIIFTKDQMKKSVQFIKN